MKKMYVKPCITVEYFTLSQSIAQSCGWTSDKFYGKPTHADIYSCAWVDASGERYWTSTPTCDGSYGEDIQVSEGCYNAPSGSQQIFAS
ncbi:hypothetical protein [Fusibacillus kribbianus]|uniref:Uncharacterized protein n=1 Tax=Fusibacillus kribbianus TaxID=3044208 RepID=A0AAP4BAE2_9FIRM|nr:hypothetical protein [Ruminococcus sp. YH-rum2234]MDI9241822.1 hypothetical protein [Ruminococcus sp. YH-rum2234]